MAQGDARPIAHVVGVDQHPVPRGAPHLHAGDAVRHADRHGLVPACGIAGPPGLSRQPSAHVVGHGPAPFRHFDADAGGRARHHDVVPSVGAEIRVTERRRGAAGRRRVHRGWARPGPRALVEQDLLARGRRHGGPSGLAVRHAFRERLGEGRRPGRTSRPHPRGQRRRVAIALGHRRPELPRAPRRRRHEEEDAAPVPRPRRHAVERLQPRQCQRPQPDHIARQIGMPAVVAVGLLARHGEEDEGGQQCGQRCRRAPALAAAHGQSRGHHAGREARQRAHVEVHQREEERAERGPLRSGVRAERRDPPEMPQVVRGRRGRDERADQSAEPPAPRTHS